MTMMETSMEASKMKNTKPNDHMIQQSHLWSYSQRKLNDGCHWFPIGIKLS